MIENMYFRAKILDATQIFMSKNDDIDSEIIYFQFFLFYSTSQYKRNANVIYLNTQAR